MSGIHSGSRVSRLGDSMTGELGMEPTGGAAHKLGFVAGQGIMRLLSGIGSVDVSAALRAAVTVNCQSISGDGLFYRIAVGEACVFRNTGFAFEMLYAPSGAAGAVCAFTQTFQFSTSGVMTIGTVPLSRMRRAEVSAKNAAVVTVTPSAGQILTLDCGTVAVGDRLFISAYLEMTKGATAGRSTLSIGKTSGTAVVSSYNDRAGVYDSWYQPASATYVKNASGILNVTTAGTLVLLLSCLSDGSDSTVAIGAGQMSAVILKDG